MTIDSDRRRVLQLSLLAATLIPVGYADSGFAASTAKPAAGGPEPGQGPEHDFDFFLGSWKVRHRRLRQRLVNSNEWDEFDGSTQCQSLLGGIANMNDSIVNRPAGASRSIGLRAFDMKTGTWVDWSLDGRDPTKVSVDGVGRFANGVGTFFADDTYEDKPVKVRGMFSPLTPASMQWEQAFSVDGGKTWETNYVMRYTRIA